MIYLLDSAAVLNNLGFSFTDPGKFVTVPGVADECRDARSRHLVQNALANSLLSLEEPSEKTIGEISALASKNGFSKLSKTDVSLLALALEFKRSGKKFALVTDDYSVQNFCSLLGIKFEPVIREGISKTISFSFKCIGCGKEFNSRKVSCPDCGSAVKSRRLG